MPDDSLILSPHDRHTAAEADAVVPPEPAPSAPGIRRIDQLDSLRGLAALIVFFAHCLLLYPTITPAMTHLVESPARLLLDGHPAVLFFFLLSGFVLYLPYSRSAATPRYAPYLVRRICRIYLPYLAGIAFAGAASVLAFHPVTNVGSGFAWHAQSHHDLVRSSLLFGSFILPFDRDVWNGSTWSLAEEMRISLVFPLIALLVRRFRWSAILPAVALVSFCCSLMIRAEHHFFPFITVHYAGIFAVGALVAKQHVALCQKFTGLKRTAIAVWLIAALGIVAYATTLTAYTPHLVAEELSDLMITAGNCVILVAALALVRFRDMLLLAPVRVLGRISYSFYLLHIPVLLLAVCLLWVRVPHLALFAVALAATTLLAMLSYRWIELPSIAFGKALTARMKR